MFVHGVMWWWNLYKHFLNKYYNVNESIITALTPNLSHTFLPSTGAMHIDKIRPFKAISHVLVMWDML